MSTEEQIEQAARQMAVELYFLQVIQLRYYQLLDPEWEELVIGGDD